MQSPIRNPAKTPPLADDIKANGYGTLPSVQAPTSRGRAKSRDPCLPSNSTQRHIAGSPAGSLVSADQERPEETVLSNLQLFLCALCLSGVQFTWTVEFAYGSPYLLDLGLSKPLMSLVWLAGPLSGLLVAPIIGSYSDQLRCRLGRRRPFMLVGASFVVASLMMVGFARELAFYWVVAVLDMPRHHPQAEVVRATRHTAAMLAVFGFYVLDFSINAIQASCRALILDCAPSHQQGVANSWASRMIGLGNVAGYFVGYLSLPRLFPFLGNGQVSVLCSVASIVLCLTVLVTSVSVAESEPEELEIPETSSRKSYAALFDILKAIRSMPHRVQQVCNIQFFAWLGWFPVLFYSTTWVTEVMARGGSPERSEDFFERATRAGAFSLLLFASVSLASSILLPAIFAWGAACADISPRGFWAGSHFLFAALMWSTLFVGSSVRAAQYILAACGICWAVAMWVPFAFIGIEMRRQEHAAAGEDDSFPVIDDVPVIQGDRDHGPESALLENGDPASRDRHESAALENGDPAGRQAAVAERVYSAGILLGIHNVYIVIPQFFTSLLSAAIFAMFAPSVPADPAPSDEFHGGSATVGEGNVVDSVGWVLRIGGVSAIIAGVLTLTRL